MFFQQKDFLLFFISFFSQRFFIQLNIYLFVF